MVVEVVIVVFIAVAVIFKRLFSRFVVACKDYDYQTKSNGNLFFSWTKHDTGLHCILKMERKIKLPSTEGRIGKRSIHR